MSIALLGEVDALKDRVKALETSMVGAVSLYDVTALIRANKTLTERVEALERKAAKRG